MPGLDKSTPVNFSNFSVCLFYGVTGLTLRAIRLVVLVIKVLKTFAPSSKDMARMFLYNLHILIFE